MNNTKIKKFDVCSECFCVSAVHLDCVCVDGNYKTIELEFEVCKCCGNLIEDGNPCDTEFNKKQIETIKS
jgi:hypothetical protein